jgi:hypothetical protein
VCDLHAKIDGGRPRSGIDAVIFETACRIAIKQGHPLIHAEPLVATLNEQGISKEQIMETQEVLEGRHYIKLHRVLAPLHAYDFSIRTHGFEQFARVGVPNYDKLCADVARILVRKVLQEKEQTSKHSIADDLGQPRTRSSVNQLKWIVVDFVLTAAISILTAHIILSVVWYDSPLSWRWSVPALLSHATDFHQTARWLSIVIPAFLTSIWLWLYAGSGFTLKFARRFDIGFQWFNRHFDIEKKPLQSIGLVAGALVAVVYWTAVIVSRIW